MYAELRQDRPGLAGAMTARGQALVLRLALIYSQLDELRRRDSIRVVHLKAALAVWEYSRASCYLLFKSHTGTPIGDRLIELLTTNGRMMKSQFTDHIGKPGHEIEEAMNALLERLRRPPEGPRAGEGAPRLDPVLRGLSAAKRGEAVILLVRATTSATDRGLSSDRPTAAVDGTGLESRHTSRYFFKRAGRKHTSRLWTKLTVACDTSSHFFAGATVTTGPSNDSPQFRPVMAQVSLIVTWDRVRADAAFDAEDHHRYAREDLGVRATVIPLNRRGQGRK